MLNYKNIVLFKSYINYNQNSYGIADIVLSQAVAVFIFVVKIKWQKDGRVLPMTTGNFHDIISS